jgi:hypothetical protein
VRAQQWPATRAKTAGELGSHSQLPSQREERTVSTEERLRRAAQRLAEASELAEPPRSVEYLALAASVRLQIRAALRGETVLGSIRELELRAERLADTAPPDSEEQRLADGCSLGLEGLRQDLGESA